MNGDADRSSSLWTAGALLLKFFRASEAENLNNPSNIVFPDPVPSSMNESYKIFLTEDPSGWSWSPNPPNVLTPLWSPERPPFPHTTPRQLLTIETPPKFFNHANKLWRWKDTILPIIYFITYSCGGFRKILIRDFIYVIFHIFYHSLFVCLSLRWRGNITSHSPLTRSVLILGNVSNSLPPFDDPNLKPPDPLMLE